MFQAPPLPYGTAVRRAAAAARYLVSSYTISIAFNPEKTIIFSKPRKNIDKKPEDV